MQTLGGDANLGGMRRMDSLGGDMPLLGSMKRMDSLGGDMPLLADQDRQAAAGSNPSILTAGSQCASKITRGRQESKAPFNVFDDEENQEDPWDQFADTEGKAPSFYNDNDNDDSGFGHGWQEEILPLPRGNRQRAQTVQVGALARGDHLRPLLHSLPAGLGG
ncbi:unnamed protein product, partial [Heterosigma akashiwo]